MMRLNNPEVSYDQSITSCRIGITGNNSLSDRLENGKGELTAASDNYSILGETGELYSIDPLQCAAGADPVVIADLMKSELVNLYEYYFRGKNPGRQEYDKILAASNEKCPFCGGIGRPRNLDHYLPKAHFPQFSVLPINLIPSCRDCNMDGKGQSYAETASAQVIHPYLDRAHFFNEQWIFANYIASADGEPSVIRYYTNPPEGWTDTDKERVTNHFIEFDIASRYSICSAQRLTEIETQIEAISSQLDVDIDAEIFNSIFFQPALSTLPLVNSWERVMYLALLDSL